MVTYSVLINRVLGNMIMPSRGLRQGDSLSPFRFVIVSKALSCLLIVAKSGRSISSLEVNRGGPNITHLFFIDDSMIFGKVRNQKVENLKHIFNWYELAYGQKINFEKSTVFFSRNTSDNDIDTICQILGVHRD